MAGFCLFDGIHRQRTDRIGHNGMIDARHDENPREMRCLVAIRRSGELPRHKPLGATGSQGWIASVFPESKAVQRSAGPKSCFAVHSFAAALRWARLPRKFRRLNACRTAGFAVRPAHGRSALSVMSDRPAKGSGKGSGNAEPASVEIDAATRRLMVALEALESAVERRREADRDENELAIRIQALGADRSRLADELDGSLVKSRRLERANREIAERLDAAIGTIRSVLDAGETS
jgi:hypothetical protein